MAENAVNSFPVVVLGGSAGSLETLLAIIKGLPPQPGAAFILVVHRKNDSASILEDLFSYQTALPVREVEDKDPLLPDHIYIAPPDYHLLIEAEDSFSLDSSEKVLFSRPSIDVTFESVAETFGNRVIGVLLSGANADGARGLLRIRELGGYTIAQDPADAGMGYMPQQAIGLGAAMMVVPGGEILGAIRRVIG